jgi:hypothetical protein
MAQLARLALGAVVGAVLLSAAKPLPRPAPRPAPAAGITFKYRVTSSAEDKKQREMKSMLATVRMQDGNIRMEYTEGMSPTGQKGGYTLVKGDPAQFIIVSDKDKQAMVMGADLFGSGMGAMLNNPMIKITTSNQSFRFKDMGAGEPILGYKTRRVRTYTSSTMEMRVLMMNNKITSNDSSDQWIASGITLDAASFERWAKSFASGVKSTNPELAAELQKYSNEYGRSGIALKTVTWSNQTDKKGKTTSDTLTMEITDLQTGAIDPAMFEVPAGYQIVDMSKAIADAKAEAAADKAADGAKDEKQKEEKPSAKDALKQGLGGMFKKKPPM